LHLDHFAISDEEKVMLSGDGEANFIAIEQKYTVKLITRNSGISIQAEEESFLKAARIALEKMQQALKTGHHLTEFYVQEIVKDNQKAGDFAAHLEKPIIIDRYGHPIQPKTQGQSKLIQVVKQNDIVLAAGPAGTGKTFLAVALAVAALEKKIVERIILVRPAVESGENLGFLPGVMSEKIAPFMRPLYDSLSVMLPPEKLKEYWDNNIIEIAPLAYMRGRTLSKSFIILDEAQNATILQMKMFLTRIGLNSKVVVTGDITQVDLGKNEKSGFAHARKILTGIEGIGQIELEVSDVVRHKLVRDIILAYEKSGFTSG
jgi:phosphate starvation-inducible protein PhoH and related proteins